ncbi:MAG: 30S ribosomal protein S12 methylthiotransferase RimO [candidate division Zixibacteria bacterium]|nr:30S ribosomal protein S12 methylthiotransferase RimO [candidate division Zixibacteria bacterium]
MANKSYYFLNLGCPKNQTDGDNIRGALNGLGLTEAESPEIVDYIIVNTCAFIEDARLETQGEIRELEEYKKNGARLIAVGCYPALSDIRKDIPAVDAAFRFNQVEELLSYVSGDKIGCHSPDQINRVVEDLPYAYLVISDGCDNRCSYCSIPMIRGGYRSRPVMSILKEAEYLAKNGIKELVLVAQDTAIYGNDIQGKPDLACLCRMLAGVGGIEWLRIMYAHPAHLSEDLLDKLFAIDKVCRYLDMPIQHISPNMLSRMKRQCGPAKIKQLINHLRKIDNDISLRTTLMVGFPGEADDDFKALLDFIEETKFDHLGAFTYSPEANTAAEDLDNRVEPELAGERYEMLYDVAEDISSQKAEAQKGIRQKLLIERESLEGGGYMEARSYRQAPEIDGFYRIPEKRGMKIGQFIEALIKDVDQAEYEV